ncbi:hypothetical protein AVEN_82941-1 [Araneus ventricosus]|uniref:Uncharacterized protein n=1 Tax=Araneus ventricosus TaxID=182803 RepID=A0A4Y2CV03_ARAVE|nr:hypothetical protein AVEN_82941-1 [Araneus ventricosus]
MVHAINEDDQEGIKQCCESYLEKCEQDAQFPGRLFGAMKLRSNQMAQLIDIIAVTGNSTSGIKSRKFDTRFCQNLSCMLIWYTLNLLNKSQTSSHWCGAKIPTLARPTQEGCKAGRGPCTLNLPTRVKRPPADVVQKYPHCPGLPKKGVRPGEDSAR